MTEYNFEDSLNRLDNGISSNSENDNKISISIPSKEDIGIGKMINANACIVSIYVDTKIDYCFPIFVNEAIDICKDWNKFIGYTFSDNNLVIIFDTPFKTDLKTVIDILGKLRSLSQILESKISKGRNVRETFRLNIGIGYYPIHLSKIFNSDNILFYGNEIDRIKLLSSKANNSLIVDSSVWNNLNDSYQDLFRKSENDGEYEGEVINIMMNNWLTK